MSISWLHFWTDGPPTPRFSTCRPTNCPRIQGGRLSITSISWPRSAPQLQIPQNQLPNSMRIDKAGGEHHEHQLATLLDRWPPLRPEAPHATKPTAQEYRREVEHHENQLAPVSLDTPRVCVHFVHVQMLFCELDCTGYQGSSLACHSSELGHFQFALLLLAHGREQLWEPVLGLVGIVKLLNVFVQPHTSEQFAASSDSL